MKILIITDNYEIKRFTTSLPTFAILTTIHRTKQLTPLLRLILKHDFKLDFWRDQSLLRLFITKFSIWKTSNLSCKCVLKGKDVVRELVINSVPLGKPSRGSCPYFFSWKRHVVFQLKRRLVLSRLQMKDNHTMELSPHPNDIRVCLVDMSGPCQTPIPMLKELLMESLWLPISLYCWGSDLCLIGHR